MMGHLDKHCGICGLEFPIWTDQRPVARCYMTEGTTTCQHAMARAHGPAMCRKLCPDAYDQNGNILPGALPRVVEAMCDAGLDFGTGLPLPKQSDIVLALLATPAEGGGDA